MNAPIVASPEPITLIGGGDTAHSVLTEALKYGKVVVCADGGADVARNAGLAPTAVIGDMDSISDAARMAFADVLHPIAEQNSTDFDKCLRNIEAPLIFGVGFLGARLDHALAVLYVLQKYRAPVILMGDHDVLFMAPAHVRLEVPVGQRVSLMPIGDARVTTKGLKWEVCDGAMSIRDFIGTSNEAAAPVVEISATGALAVILPPEALPTVVAGLQAAVHAG